MHIRTRNNEHIYHITNNVPEILTNAEALIRLKKAVESHLLDSTNYLGSRIYNPIMIMIIIKLINMVRLNQLSVESMRVYACTIPTQKRAYRLKRTLWLRTSFIGLRAKKRQLAKRHTHTHTPNTIRTEQNSIRSYDFRVYGIPSIRFRGHRCPSIRKCNRLVILFC